MDVSAVYTFGSISLNNGTLFSTDDMYYLTEPPAGLDGAPLRFPQDLVPLGDGGLPHNAWKGPRHITFKGIILIQSTRNMDDIRDIRNQMEKDLRDALDAIIYPSTATLSWTPAGQSACSLEVSRETEVTFTLGDNFLTDIFTFGLYAADPDYV